MKSRMTVLAMSAFIALTGTNIKGTAQSTQPSVTGSIAIRYPNEPFPTTMGGTAYAGDTLAA